MTNETNHTILGIDPGATSGAWCKLICSPAGDILDTDWDIMPPTYMLADVLDDANRDSRLMVYLEKAQTMPKQGGVSVFRYGEHYGKIQGILVALKIPHEAVHPSTWTKTMHAGTSIAGKGRQQAKARSLEAATRLFPGRDLRATPQSRKPHDGIVDAMLIAEYGRRSYFIKRDKAS